jgi:uncharacterized membrane protein
MFNDLIKQIVSILRYIAGPVVGLVVVLLADDRHEIKALACAIWSWSEPRFLWLMVGFLAVVGLTVYYAHRTLIHYPLLLRFFVRLHTRTLVQKPSVDELAFARWKRRGAADHTDEKSVQNQLDETNAAGHFFYCSAWSALLFRWIMCNKFPEWYPPTCCSWVIFWVIIVVLFLTALLTDYRTTRWDIKAYNDFKNIK